MFTSIRNWLRRWRYREGRTLSWFIARDIRRDILVVSSAKVDDGLIIGRVRTTNVLYLSNGLIPEPEFEPARELRIDEMWRWTGKSWGGLPDGTSIVDGVVARSPDAEQGAAADGGRDPGSS
jgi:hypothetical protein